MSVFRRRVVFRDGRETRSFGGASIVTAVLSAAAIVLAGTASGSTTGSSGDASGTIVVGGGTVSSITIEVSGSGSVVLAGTAVGSSVNLSLATGSVVLGGTARCDAIGSGAIVFSGSATVGSVFTMDAAGTIAFAGTAAPVNGTTATGEVVFAGTIGIGEISGGTVNSAAFGSVLLAGTATGAIGSALNVPNQFYFETEFNVARNTVITSRPERILGNAQPANLLITNGEYSINGGAFSSIPTTIAAGATIRLRHTSSDEYDTRVTTTLNLSGIMADFVSITAERLHGRRPPWKRRIHGHRRNKA